MAGGMSPLGDAKGCVMYEHRTVRFNVMLSPSEHAKLVELASETGVSRGAILRFALRRWHGDFETAKREGRDRVSEGRQLWLPE